MRRTLTADRSRQGFGQLLLAVLLGATAGLFISGYWLVDLLPAASRLLILFSAMAGTAAALAYSWSMPRILSRLRGLSSGEKAGFLLGSVPLACFLFFAGTSQWQAPGRYIGFLLPSQQFTLTSSDAPPGTSIAWITTSMGDVSYDTLVFAGWDRRGEQMVLQDPVHNTMQWHGKPGERMEIVFANPGANTEFKIRWGDEGEIIHLKPGKASYERSFAVPFHASRQFVLALGLLHFWLLSAASLVMGRQLPQSRSGADKAATGNPLSRASIAQEFPVLVAMMGVALLLRMFNLAATFPAVDEYYHLIAADQLLNGAPLGSVYSRGLWIVTIPVAAAMGLLGHEVWVARAIGAVFNVLAMVPLYILARRVSKAVAIAAVLLYASSPWVITFARVAREYAYYPVYFYAIVLAMVGLVEAIPKDFVLTRDWRRLPGPRIAILVCLLILPPVYALRIDWLSTFRTILIAYLVLGAFALARFDWRARENWPFLGAAAILLVWAGCYFYREQMTKMLLVPRINLVPLNYFFPNPPQQWYYNRSALIIAIAVVGAGAMALRRHQIALVPAFFTALFVGYLAVFALFSKSFFHTRHLISTQFWFVVLTGIGLCWLWEGLRLAVPWKGMGTQVVLALALGVLVLNPQQMLLPTLSPDPDMPISEDYLHDMSAVQTYMLSHVRQGDALISTVYGLYVTWEGEPRFGDQFRINAGTSLEEIASIVEGHDSGWIVIDEIRLDMSELSVRSLTDMAQMEYIGSFGDEYVWRWGPPLAASSASAF